MKITHKLIAACCILALATSCGKKEKDYKAKLDVKVAPVEGLTFARYEAALFHLDTAHFQAELMHIQNDYLPFLDGDLNNPDAVQYLKDFATDAFMMELEQKVEAAFPNLDFVQKTVADVLSHFRYYYPDIQLPKKIYTCVTGVSPDTPSVIIMDDNLLISLDWYLEKDEVYDRMGMPRYISERTVKATMAKDIALQLYRTYIYEWRKETNLADEMVNAGKIDYFVEAMVPDLADEVLLGYSEAQMAWATKNEGELWADIVGNQRLYSTGLDMHLTYLADGPFTQEYSNEAPARLGEFLGLQIVRSYMGSHDVTLNQLMENADFQGIFQTSGYKPKK